MELLDQYLQAIKKGLPKAQQDDIIAELSANIESQFKDKELELGRPLSGAEQEAILNQHGDPLRVAARYRSDQRRLVIGRQLIGPALFPAYISVLWLNVALATFVVVAISLLVHAPIVYTVLNAIVWALLQAGIITIVFASQEKQSSKPLDELRKSYIRAVSAFVPKARRSEIQNELSSQLASRIAAKTRQLGRPLNEAEQDAIFRQMGQPLAMAENFLSREGTVTRRPLIGSALLPIYQRVVTLNGVIAACVVVAIAHYERTPPQQMIPTLVFHVLLQMGIVTLIFALAQYYATRHQDPWGPRQW
jgi:hypothetical protein